MENKRLLGHIAAIFTIIVWGTTFISTKVLLTDFQPVEILFVRMLLGLVALFIVSPRPMKGLTLKQELTFAAAGLTGITMYYLMENIALTYTMASNVGVIVSVSPIFTVILASIFLKSEGKLRVHFFLGFIVAMIGIALISFNGAKLQLNPIGDFLSLGSAFVWGWYSILSKNIGEYVESAREKKCGVFEFSVRVFAGAYDGETLEIKIW